MALAPIQQISGTAAITAPTLTLGATPTVGNTLVAIMASDDYDTALPTAGAGRSYTQRLSSENNLGFYIWTRKVVSGDSATTTFGIGSATHSAAAVLEIQGDYDKVGTVTTTNNSAAGTQVTSGLSPATTDNIVLAVFGGTTTNTVLSGFSVDNGFTNAISAINAASGAGRANAHVAYKLTGATSATGTTTISWSGLSSDRSGAQVAFTAIAGGGGNDKVASAAFTLAMPVTGAASKSVSSTSAIPIDMAVNNPDVGAKNSNSDVALAMLVAGTAAQSGVAVVNLHDLAFAVGGASAKAGTSSTAHALSLLLGATDTKDGAAVAAIALGLSLGAAVTASERAANAAITLALDVGFTGVDTPSGDDRAAAAAIVMSLNLVNAAAKSGLSSSELPLSILMSALVTDRTKSGVAGVSLAMQVSTTASKLASSVAQTTLALALGGTSAKQAYVLWNEEFALAVTSSGIVHGPVPVAPFVRELVWLLAERTLDATFPDRLLIDVTPERTAEIQ